MRCTDNTFVKRFEKIVEQTIREYNLIRKKDKVAVAVSGGKDSTSVLFILHKLGYDVRAFTIDISAGFYSNESLSKIKEFCSSHDITYEVMKFEKEYGLSLQKIRKKLIKKDNALSFCSVCGVLKRRLLNKKLKSLSVDKIVTGHNLDDEVESIMMNMLRSNLATTARLGPKPGLVKNPGFVPRVKPLYFCPEKEILRYSQIMKLPVHYGSCPYRGTSYRYQLKKVLEDYFQGDQRKKKHILKAVIAIMPKLKRYYRKNLAQAYCHICHEPSQKNVCRACEIITTVTGQA